MRIGEAPTAEVLRNLCHQVREDHPVVGPEAEKRVGAMREAIDEIASALERLGRSSPWDPGTKVGDDFLAPLFRAYFRKLGLPEDLMTKKSFYELAEHVAPEELDPEVREKLDAIAAVAASATPAGA